MKKLIIILLCTLSLTKIIAQESNDLAKKAKRDFEGIWVGTTNVDTTVTIILFQTRIKSEDIIPVDSIVFLYGWHKISISKIAIESSLDSMSKGFEKNATIVASYNERKRMLQLNIRDLSRNRWLSGELTLSGKNKAILNTRLKEVWRNDNKTYPEGQTFPKKLIMKRVSKKVVL